MENVQPVKSKWKRRITWSVILLIKNWITYRSLVADLNRVSSSSRFNVKKTSTLKWTSFFLCGEAIPYWTKGNGDETWKRSTWGKLGTKESWAALWWTRRSNGVDHPSSGHGNYLDVLCIPHFTRFYWVSLMGRLSLGSMIFVLFYEFHRIQNTVCKRIWLTWAHGFFY